MKNLLAISTFIIFTLVSCYASAEVQPQNEVSSPPEKNGHVYAAFDVGQGTAANYCPTQSAGVTCNNVTSTTQFGLGYHFSKNVAIEAGYLSSGDLTSSSCTTTICVNGGGSTETKSSLSGLRLSVEMSVPVNDTFSLIGKLGTFNSTISSTNKHPGNLLSTSSSFDNSTVTYGLGARINLNDRIALRVLFEDLGVVKSSSAGTGSNLTMVSGGLVVNF
jgi:opacity protein-like surface antigen